MPAYGQRVNQDTVVSTNICFYVSTADIVKNDPGYDKYLNEMLPFMYDNINNLDSIVIRGAASPDGTDKFNSYLSEKRAEKIAKDAVKALPEYLSQAQEIFPEITFDVQPEE